MKKQMRNLKSGTNSFNPGHWDSIPITGTVPAKPGRLECLNWYYLGCFRGSVRSTFDQYFKLLKLQCSCFITLTTMRISIKALLISILKYTSVVRN